MQIIILLAVAFIICFLLFFKMVHRGNKQETGDEKLGKWNLMLVVFILTLIPVALIGLFVFVLLGSTNIINVLFSLQISTKQIVILAIALLIYLCTLDNVFEMIGSLLIRQKPANILVMLFTRVFIFYMISLFVGLEQINACIMAFGVAVMVSLIEIIFYLKEKEKSKAHE